MSPLLLVLLNLSDLPLCPYRPRSLLSVLLFSSYSPLLAIAAYCLVDWKLMPGHPCLPSFSVLHLEVRCSLSGVDPSTEPKQPVKWNCRTTFEILYCCPLLLVCVPYYVLDCCFLIVAVCFRTFPSDVPYCCPVVLLIILFCILDCCPVIVTLCPCSLFSLFFLDCNTVTWTFLWHHTAASSLLCLTFCPCDSFLCHIASP